MSENRKSSRLLHLYWVIGVMIVLMLGLGAYVIAFQFDDENCSKTMGYLSVFSVLLSVILSIFAILYTYISNVEVQHQFEKINSAACGIQDTSVKLAVTNDLLNENIGAIIERLEAISKSQKELKDAINPQLGSLTDNTAP